MIGEADDGQAGDWGSDLQAYRKLNNVHKIIHRNFTQFLIYMLSIHVSVSDIICREAW